MDTGIQKRIQELKLEKPGPMVIIEILKEENELMNNKFSIELGEKIKMLRQAYFKANYKGNKTYDYQNNK